MTVIELGDVSGDPAEDTGRPGEFRHGTVRRMVLAGLLVLCAAVFGGSARPAPPLVRELWSVPFTESDWMTVNGDLLVVYRSGNRQPGLTAYDMATGATRWTHPSDDRSAGMDSSETAGLVLLFGDQRTESVEFDDGSQGVTTYGGTVTALDRATGTRLWSRPGGYHMAAGPDTILLAEHGPDNGPVTLRLVRTRDGGIVWQQDVPGTMDVAVQLDGGVPTRIITATKDGLVTVFGYTDGRPVLSKRLPWTAREPNSGTGSSISTTPDLLLENRTSDTDSVVTAYRIDTLERLWSATGPGYLWSHSCGPVICLTGPSSFRAVDPITGAQRWTGPGSPTTDVVPGDEFLLVAGADGQPRQVLTEAATGRAVGAPGNGWIAYSEPADRFVVLLDALVKDHTRSVVSRFDLTTGRSHRLGTIPMVQGLCTGTGRYLACHNAGRLIVHTLG